MIKNGDFVVYESLAIMKYLDDKYPEPSLFGRSPDTGAQIMMSVCECVSYIEAPIVEIVRPIFFGGIGDRREAMISAATVLREEYSLLNARLTDRRWLVGESVTAADIMLYPQTAVLLRALGKDQAAALDLKLMPFTNRFPAVAQWMKNVEALSRYDKTYPPHWRQ